MTWLVVCADQDSSQELTLCSPMFHSCEDIPLHDSIKVFLALHRLCLMLSILLRNFVFLGHGSFGTCGALYILKAVLRPPVLLIEWNSSHLSGSYHGPCVEHSAVISGQMIVKPTFDDSPTILQGRNHHQNSVFGIRYPLMCLCQGRQWNRRWPMEKMRSFLCLCGIVLFKHVSVFF